MNKYINENDLEELGLKKSEMSGYYYKDKYYLYMYPNTISIIRGSYGDSEVVFNGTIKNKAQLELVLLMVGLIKE